MPLGPLTVFLFCSQSASCASAFHCSRLARSDALHRSLPARGGRLLAGGQMHGLGKRVVEGLHTTGGVHMVENHPHRSETTKRLLRRVCRGLCRVPFSSDLRACRSAWRQPCRVLGTSVDPGEAPCLVWAKIASDLRRSRSHAHAACNPPAGSRRTSSRLGGNQHRRWSEPGTFLPGEARRSRPALPSSDRPGGV